MSSGLLERMLESWLTSLRERGQLDVSFRALLQTAGFEPLGRKTTHGPLEFGKDVAAWKPSERVLYLFQLKAGDVAPSDWSDMQTQLQQLVLVPYDHPNYAVGDPFVPVWVCSGEMTPTVKAMLAQQNEAYRKEGRAAVLVWERPKLISMFREHLFAVHAIDVRSAIEHIRIWTRLTSYDADKDDLRDFYRAYLSQWDSLRGKDHSRLLCAYIVCMAQFAQRYLRLDDPYSAADCVVLGSVRLFELMARKRLAPKSRDTIVQSCRWLLVEYLDVVTERVSSLGERPDLWRSDGGLSEVFEYPLRIHSICSKLVLSAFIKEQLGLDVSQECKLLGATMRHNQTFAHLLSERQAGTLVVALLGLIRYGYRDLAIQMLCAAWRWLTPLFGHPDLLGLPSPYQPLESIPDHWLRTAPEGSEHENEAAGAHSCLLVPLLNLAVRLGQKGAVEKAWPRISRISLEKYVPADEGDLYAYLPEGGQTRSRIYPATHSWQALDKEASVRPDKKLLRLARQYPESLLLLSLAYPWRACYCEPSLYCRI